MTVTPTDLKYVCALVFGTLVVLLNTLPFIFRIINKTKEAKESDNFNLFIVIVNSYFFLVIIGVGIMTVVYIIDAMDKLKYLNLLGSGGAFDLFWTTGLDNSTTVSASATFFIKLIRTLYEWLAIISAILLLIFGFVGGYNFQKKMATKNGQDIDWLSYFAGTVGVFLGVVLLKLYSVVTSFSLFISGNQTITDVIVATFTKGMLTP